MQARNVTRPNLFVIGAMKSGTSSLFQNLDAHPEVFMSPVKEPMHFSREDNWSKGNEQYLKLFAQAENEIYLGEASTEYSKRPFREGVAQRLYEFNPSARIVYIMRDPFERLVSQYKHVVRARRESRRLSEALRNPSEYMTNSYYAYQLRPYLNLFGRDSIYLGTLESLNASPEQFCEQLFHWLEIDVSFKSPNFDQRFNVSPSRIESLDSSFLGAKLTAVVKRYPIIKNLLPPVTQEWIRKLIPRKVVMDFQSNEFRSEVGEVRRIVGPVLREWTDELVKLTGNSYAMWPTTHISTETSDSRVSEELWLPDSLI
jgi:hypothetical protein